MTSRLIELLDELSLLMSDLGHDHCAAWMADGSRMLRQGDFGGVQHVLRAYGSMRSFNDLIFEIGDSSSPARAERADALRSEVWSVADAIRRDVEFR